MAETSTDATPRPVAGPPAIAAAQLEQARGRLSDRGIEPDRVLGRGELGNDITVAGFYALLEVVSATEKAGQAPTYAMARIALRAGLPNEIADALFLAYNQQSAEEAGHGDKVFGGTFYAMGGFAPAAGQSVVGSAQPGAFLQPVEDPKENKKRLGGMAGLLGGIETVALNRAFPLIVSLCEQWNHPIGNDLLAQIRDTVRPEESRHVLTWRYVFHKMIAPKGENVIAAFLGATNAGRRQLGAPELDRDAFVRLMGTTAPTQRQLLGKDRVAFS